VQDGGSYVKRRISGQATTSDLFPPFVKGDFEGSFTLSFASLAGKAFFNFLSIAILSSLYLRTSLTFPSHAQFMTLGVIVSF
jgi:hypothetical protein